MADPRCLIDHMLALQNELDAERARRWAETQRADRERTLRIAAEQSGGITADELAELRGRAELVEVTREENDSLQAWVDRLRADYARVQAERDAARKEIANVRSLLNGRPVHMRPDGTLQIGIAAEDPRGDAA